MRSIFFLSVLFLICSCTVEEGKGGRATIQGKVFVDDFNQEGDLIVSDYAPDWEVFIVYGDEEGYSDATTTHHDGTYVFNYLYEGTYEIYAYSKCNSCANNREEISITAEITSADEVLILEDINVVD